MSDISIPTGAMMALYNLKQIGADLVTTQNEISTGRIVNGPKDNSAVWTQTEKMKFEHAGVQPPIFAHSFLVSLIGFLGRVGACLMRDEV